MGMSSAEDRTQTKAGLHLGTEAEGCWWRRYPGGGFLARGNGRMWTDERGVYFHRYLTAEPLHITWSLVHSIQRGTCH